jgi:hypothetical protein
LQGREVQKLIFRQLFKNFTTHQQQKQCHFTKEVVGFYYRLQLQFKVLEQRKLILEEVLTGKTYC